MTETQQLPRYRLEYYDSSDLLPVGFDESDDLHELISLADEAWNEQPRAVTSLVLVEMQGEGFDNVEVVQSWVDDEEESDFRYVLECHTAVGAKPLKDRPGYAEVGDDLPCLLARAAHFWREQPRPYAYLVLVEWPDGAPKVLREWRQDAAADIMP